MSNNTITTPGQPPWPTPSWPASRCTGIRARASSCVEPWRLERSTAPSAVTPFVSQALAAEAGGGDAEILNFALTLEYLEADFYNVKGKSLSLSGRGQELRQAVRRRGGRARDRPDGGHQTAGCHAGGETDVRCSRSTSESSFLTLASVLENTGVGAYNGAAPSLQSKQVLAAAGSIVQIEARHAAAIDLLIGKSPTPSEGFDTPLTKAQVLAKAGPLIKK